MSKAKQSTKKYYFGYMILFENTRIRFFYSDSLESNANAILTVSNVVKGYPTEEELYNKVKNGNLKDLIKTNDSQEVIDALSNSLSENWNQIRSLFLTQKTNLRKAQQSK